MQIVFPTQVEPQADPMDPEVMIDVVQSEELIINLLDVQGTSQMVEQTDDKTGEMTIEEEYSITRLVADIRYAGEKITAVDATITYDAQGDMTNIEIAWYLDPYIYTNSFSRDVTTDVAGNKIEHATMDIHIYGPAGCGVQLLLDTTTTTDPQDNETSTQDITFTLNNTTLEIQTQNFNDMIDDIKNHRLTVPTATSSPQTASYLVDAKIYHKGDYRAYIYPEDNTWKV